MSLKNEVGVGFILQNVLLNDLVNKLKLVLKIYNTSIFIYLHVTVGFLLCAIKSVGYM